jgi:hypothetical protein
MALVMYTLLAEHERKNDSEPLGPPHEEDARNDIVAMLTGLLTAPTRS